MINCQICEHNPTGERCELFGRVIGMHGCSSVVERKPRNRFERVKQMTMEEMAAYIDKHTAEAMWCNSPPEECPPDGECVKCILNWLKGAIE